MVVYTTIICRKIDKRRCILIAEKGNENIEIGFKIPFFKTERNIWKFIHIIKKVFEKKGFKLTGSQISSALSSEYPNIPYVYY